MIPSSFAAKKTQNVLKTLKTIINANANSNRFDKYTFVTSLDNKTQRAKKMQILESKKQEIKHCKWK